MGLGSGLGLELELGLGVGLGLGLRSGLGILGFRVGVTVKVRDLHGARGLAIDDGVRCAPVCALPTCCSRSSTEALMRDGAERSTSCA